MFCYCGSPVSCVASQAYSIIVTLMSDVRLNKLCSIIVALLSTAWLVKLYSIVVLLLSVCFQ